MDLKLPPIQPEPPEFVALVDELQAFSGRRCRHPLREKCLAAFVASPDGFRRVADRARTEARNVWGLINWAIDHGEHLLGPNAKPRVRGVGACCVCERLVRDALLFGGQWWCPEHEEPAA